uniref:LemA family protein n=1 Tax=Heterorhabditis bacteriophora TaxID=37862 RepID=A0A1I7WLI6_HETBA
MDDEVPAKGRDMKTLREDATSSITLAWKDARKETGALTEKIKITSDTLEAQLNASFEEVGRRINRMPRIASLVRAATAGQDPLVQKERAVEEFISRLRADVRYYVKLDNPNIFEAALAKAQTVEQLLAEATAERLINPASAAPEVIVNTANLSINSSLQNYNEQARTTPVTTTFAAVQKTATPATTPVPEDI